MTISHVLTRDHPTSAPKWVPPGRIPRRTPLLKPSAPARHGPLPRHIPPAYSPVPVVAIMAALRSSFLNRRDPRPAFEAALCSRYHGNDALLFGSGTHALAAAIVAAASRTPGHRVVALPAYACADVASAAVAADARVALYDIDPCTLGPDLASLEAVISAGAHVVVIAPLYGVPVDWDAIDHLAARYGAVVIEDAAQGHGATWRGAPLGSHAPLSVLSFGRGKGWTGGAGGAIIARGDVKLARAVCDAAAKLADPVTDWSLLARALALSTLAHPHAFAIPSAMPWLHLGETRYRAPGTARQVAPFAVRLLEATAHAAEQEAVARKRAAGAFTSAIEQLPATRNATHLRTFHSPSSGSAGWLRMPIRLARGYRAFASCERMRQLGVGYAYPATLAELPAVRAHMMSGTAVWRWPGAETLVRELVTLPTHSLATDSDRAEIIEHLNAARA